MSAPVNIGGQAFPLSNNCPQFLGMTLRDWFAGQALASAYCNDPEADADEIASYAYTLADAMLAERAQGGGQ